MARRLLAAGHVVSMCDPSDAAVQALCAQGAARLADPAGAAAATEMTITSLPTPEIIESVVLAVALARSEGLDLATVYEIVSNAHRGFSCASQPVPGPRSGARGTGQQRVGAAVPG